VTSGLAETNAYHRVYDNLRADCHDHVEIWEPKIMALIFFTKNFTEPF